jgi:poly(3-hydroxybutyrate) depolymerase
MTRLPHNAQEGSSRVELFAWTNCASGGPVMLYRVNGGGHPPPTLGENASAHRFMPPNHDIETSQVLWDAFAAIRPKAP